MRNDKAEEFVQKIGTEKRKMMRNKDVNKNERRKVLNIFES